MVQIPRRIEVAIVGDSASLERAFGRAKASSRGFVGSLEGAGNAIASVAKKAAVASIAVGGAMAFAGKAALDFNQQMLLIQTQAGASAAEVKRLSGQVLDLARIMPQGPTELAQGLYHLESLGLRGAKAMQTLKIAALASGQGMANLEDAATALGGVVVTGIKGAENYQKAMATLVATVGAGNVRMEDLAQAIGNVAPSAAAAGISLTEMGAAMATLTDRGFSAEEAATRLRFALALLQRPTPNAVKSLKDLGVNANQLGATLREPNGLLKVLELLHAGVQRVGTVRGNRDILASFGGARSGLGIQTLVQSLNQGLSSFQAKLIQVAAGEKQYAANQKAYLESPAYRLHAAFSTMQSDLIKVGAAFIPLGVKAADGAAKVADAITSMIDKFSAARTLHAKLNVVWTGAEQAGKRAESALQHAVAQVDWQKVWADARGIADGLQKRLDAVDWSSVGKAIGDGIAQGVAKASGVAKELAQRFEEAFRSIDWNKLGRSAGPGIAAALLSALATVADPSFWVKNWDLVLAVAATVFTDGIGKIAGKLAAPLTRLLGDSFLRSLGAIERISPRLASLLLAAGVRGAEALARGFAKAGELVGRVFERLAKRIGRPLAFVVKVLGLQAAIDAVVRAFEGIARVIKHALDDAFRALKIKAIKAALDIIEPFTHLPKQLGGGPFQAMKRSLQQTLAAMQQDGAKGGAATGQAITRSMAAAISGGLGAVRDASETAAKVASGVARSAATAAASAATAAAATTPPTAATTPTPAAPSAPTSTRTGITADQRNNWFDSRISRMLDRVQDLPTLKAQIARLGQISKLISDRIKVTKDITRKLTLEDQLVNVRRQIKPLQQQQKDALQFQQLGLGPTGDTRVPLVKTLQRQLANVSQAVQGSFLDTSKTRSVLANIKKVLSAGIGNVSETVRAKIKEMLDGINQQLADHARNLTKFKHVNSAAFVKALGIDLPPDQLRKLRQGISQLGAGNTIPAIRSQAFALTGAAGTQTTIVQIDGREVGRAVTKHQAREPKRQPSRRG